MLLYLMVISSFVLGFVLRRVRILGHNVADVLTPVLNGWIINLALPALILTTVSSLEFKADFLFALLAPWVLLLLVYVVVLLLARRLGWSREVTIVVVLLLSLGNTAFLGVPLIQKLMGETASAVAIVYDQLGSFLILSFIATALIASVRVGQQQTLGRRLVEPLRFPPFLALLLAVLLSLFPELKVGEVWPALEAVLHAISVTLLPLAMVVIGLRLQLKFEAVNMSPLLVILVGKLVVIPALVFAVARGIDIAPEVAAPSVMQAAMPPMVTGVILCLRARVAADFAITALGLGTIFSALTLPLWFLLLQLY